MFAVFPLFAPHLGLRFDLLQSLFVYLFLLLIVKESKYLNIICLLVNDDCQPFLELRQRLPGLPVQEYGLVLSLEAEIDTLHKKRE